MGSLGFWLKGNVSNRLKQFVSNLLEVFPGLPELQKPVAEPAKEIGAGKSGCLTAARQVERLSKLVGYKASA